MYIRKLGYVIKHRHDNFYVSGCKSLGNIFATLWCSDLKESKCFFSRASAKKWARKRGLGDSYFYELFLGADGSLYIP